MMYIIDFVSLNNSEKIHELIAGGKRLCGSLPSTTCKTMYMRERPLDFPRF